MIQRICEFYGCLSVVKFHRAKCGRSWLVDWVQAGGVRSLQTLRQARHANVR